MRELNRGRDRGYMEIETDESWTEIETEDTERDRDR